jgi:hypothetical protein
MISKVWTKPKTQQVIKALRNAGYTVEKLSAGYECKIDGEVAFKAMQGRNGYLVRYSTDLLHS